MKKQKIFKIFLFIVFAIGFFFHIHVPGIILADAGFDSDYGSDYDSGYGGGYDNDWGGSSSGSSNNNYYGSSSSNYSGGGGDSSVVVVIAIVLIVVVLCITIMKLVLIASDSSKRRPVAPINTFGMLVDDELNAQVFEMYKQINDAWMNKDLTSVRNLLTDEMYSMYEMQLYTLSEDGHTNIMGDYKFVSGHIYYRRKYKNKETVEMIFRVLCKDYIVDSNNKVVRGRKRSTWDYTYEMKLVRNVDNKTIICPSCGNYLEAEDGIDCPHCHSIIHTNTNSYRLANKRMLRQVEKR